jgi:hypothetical protein
MDVVVFLVTEGGDMKSVDDERQSGKFAEQEFFNTY